MTLTPALRIEDEMDIWPKITLHIVGRADGGVRITSPDILGLIMSHNDKAAVFRDLPLVIDELIKRNGYRRVYPLAASTGEGLSMGYFGPGAYSWRGEHLVRLDEQYRKCVVLIGAGDPSSDESISPWGSGFLVVADAHGVPTRYLVTAAHVVADKADCPFSIRYNTNAGGAKTDHIEKPEWHFHPTERDTVDVAVHIVEIPDWAEFTVIPKYPVILLEDRMESKNFGAGSRTYTVGLFKFLHGDKRNQPFVYTGHIGLIPEDQKISVEAWPKSHRAPNKRVLVDAYLVEGEPLDGASGSPVFVRRTLPHPVDKGEKKPLEGYIEGSVWLLGLQSDAYRGRPGHEYQAPMGGLIPRGVNVVVPSMKIAEVLDQDALKRHREMKKDQRENDLLPMKTSAQTGVQAAPATLSKPHRTVPKPHIVGAKKKKPRSDADYDPNVTRCPDIIEEIWGDPKQREKAERK